MLCSFVKEMRMASEIRHEEKSGDEVSFYVEVFMGSVGIFVVLSALATAAAPRSAGVKAEEADGIGA